MKDYRRPTKSLRPEESGMNLSRLFWFKFYDTYTTKSRNLPNGQTPHVICEPNDL